MFSCLQILEAFLWFVLITLLNVTLIILTLSVSRLLNLLLRLVAFLLFLNPQCLASISRWITASSSWKRFCLFVCRELSSIMVIFMLTAIRLLLTFVIFFYQAEDGIRILYVTGVQTCALPISAGSSRALMMRMTPESFSHRTRCKVAAGDSPTRRASSTFVRSASACRAVRSCTSTSSSAAVILQNIISLSCLDLQFRAGNR